MLCSYGCGYNAITKFKNGKFCCNIDYRKCPSLSIKRGNGLKENWKNRSESEINDFKKKQSEITKAKWKDLNSKLGSDEHRKKISEKSKEMWKDKDFRENMTEKIKLSWTKEKRKLVSDRNKILWKNGVFSGEEYIKALKKGTKKGWKNNVERKNNLSNKIKEQWNNPDSIFRNIEVKNKRVESLKKIWNDPKKRKKQKIKQKKIWNDPIKKENARIRSTNNFSDPYYIEKLRKGLNQKPNKPETTLINLFKNLNLEYKYVGDFTLWIGTKNPDFICKNRKKIIEFFGTYYHKIEDENYRINYFSNYGYETLIVWENELSDMEKVKNKVLKFSKG